MHRGLDEGGVALSSFFLSFFLFPLSVFLPFPPHLSTSVITRAQGQGRGGGHSIGVTVGRVFLNINLHEIAVIKCVEKKNRWIVKVQ